MKLLFLGAPRTATHSLFEALSEHNSINGSIEKEMMNKRYDHIFTEKYIEQFKINDNTKILLDGTPGGYTYYKNYIKRISNKLHLPVKIIYPIRNPFDRLYSTLKQNIVRFNMHGNPMYFMNNEGIINEDKILPFLKYNMDSRFINDAYDITDDILFFRFDQIKLNDIFDFLDIEQRDIQLNKLNSMEVWYKKPFEKYRKQIDEFWNKNYDRISQMIFNDLSKIKDKIGDVNIDDFIEQTGKSEDRFDLVSVCCTTVCNAKCSLCSRTIVKEVAEKKIHLDLEVIYPFLDRINFLSLNGAFGDAIHNPKIIPFLKKCEEYPYLMTEIATNGGAKSTSFWSELGKIKNLIVTFGIDGLEDIHYRYRKTNFNKVIENMKAYIASGGNAIWQYILFDYNKHQTEEARQLAKELGCEEFKIIRSIEYNNEFKRPDENINSRNAIIKKTTVPYCYWRFRNGNPFRSIAIDVFGYVHPCCHIAVYSHPSFINSPKYKELKPIFVKNREKLSLYNNTIDDITSNEYFRYVYDNFRLKLCDMKCGGSVIFSDENKRKYKEDQPKTIERKRFY